MATKSPFPKLEINRSKTGFYAGHSVEIAVITKDQEQTQETLSSLKALMSLIPLIGVSISLILVYFYPIDRNFHKKLIEDIENRKIQNV